MRHLFFELFNSVSHLLSLFLLLFLQLLIFIFHLPYHFRLLLNSLLLFFFNLHGSIMVLLILLKALLNRFFLTFKSFACFFKSSNLFNEIICFVLYFILCWFDIFEVSAFSWCSWKRRSFFVVKMWFSNLVRKDDKERRRRIPFESSAIEVSRSFTLLC